MADDVDIAQERQERVEAAMGPRLRYDLPPGTPGDCRSCGHFNERLVGGDCARCREPTPMQRAVSGGLR
jgi:hypothetical protein